MKTSFIFRLPLMSSSVLKKKWSQYNGFWLSYQKKCVWNIFVSDVYLPEKTSTESTNSLIAHLTSFHLTVKIENVDSCHAKNLDLALLISC